MDNRAMKLLLARIIFGTFIVIVAALLVKTITVGGSVRMTIMLSGFTGVFLVAGYLIASNMYK